MNLHFEVVGEGRPVVILHGLLGSADNWRSMRRRLGAYYRVFALDLCNHGRSPHSNILDYDVMTADVWEFMEQQALRRIILLGHSMGGKVAMQFAIEHSEQVDRLIVGRYCSEGLRTLSALSIEGYAVVGSVTLQIFCRCRCRSGTRGFKRVFAAISNQEFGPRRKWPPPLEIAFGSDRSELRETLACACVG